MNPEIQKNKKETAEELRESRDQLHAILQGVTEGVAVLDQRGQFIFANKTGAALCGFSSVEEFLSTPMADLMSAFEVMDERGKPFSIDALPGRLALKGVKNPPEILLRTRVKKTGEEKWSIATATPILNDKGQVVQAVCIFRDFSERKRIEDQIKETGERLKLAVSSAAIGTWDWDIRSNKLLWDEVCEKYFGFAPGSFDGDPKSFLKQIHSSDSTRVWEAIRNATDKKTDYKIDFRMKFKTGETRWARTTGKALYDQSGTAYRVLGTISDITDQRTEEIAAKFMAKSSALLSSSLNYLETLKTLAELAVPELADWCAIDVIDETTGRPNTIAVAHIDPAKLQWAKDLQDKYPTDWDAPTGSPNVIKTGLSELYSDISEELLKASARDEEHYKIIRELQIKSAMIVPLKSRGRILGAITMIGAESGRRYTDADVKTAEALASRAATAIDNSILYKQAQNAIKIRDDFLSVASHELRTPLTTLFMQLQLVGRTLSHATDQGGSLDLSKLASKIDVTLKQSKQLAELIDSLLDVSRLGTGKIVLNRESIDITNVVGETLQGFSEVARRVGSEILFNSDRKIYGNWDKLRLTQAISNIVSNAMKYGAGKPVTVSVKANDERCQINITDQGIGIAPEDQARIFERFERAMSHKNISGLGLGLYITKEIVQAHNGKITVKSEPQIGSTFTIELPLT